MSVGGYNAVMRGCTRIITVLRPVTPKRMGTNGSKINDAGVLTLKEACSRRYSGTLKRSVLTFVFDRTRNEPFGAVLCGNTRENSREIRRFTIIYCANTHSFSPGLSYAPNPPHTLKRISMHLYLWHLEYTIYFSISKTFSTSHS